MAITLADFTKIWASTSPLTPYSFSDSNYQEGWNFVGATPPARQMWDSIQKQNDEKLKYIVDNFLPLSGGTMTGAIVNNDTVIKHSVDTGFIRIDGGSSDNDGATLSLWGDSHTSNAGEFRLRANDGNSNAYFSGKADGTLTWEGNDISGNLEDFTNQVTFAETYARASCVRVGRLCIIMYQGENKTHAQNDVVMTMPTAYRPVDVISSQYHIIGRYNQEAGGFNFNGNGQLLCTNGNSATARIYLQFCYFC